MKLTKKEIEHIADLARLELDDNELKLYGNQLSDILDFIDQLQEVDTTGVEPTAQVTGLINIWREDKVLVWDKQEQADALVQAPALEDEQIKVKRVLK